MNELVNLLLASRRLFTGGKQLGTLIRFGGLTTRVPVFPPGLTITWEVRPAQGAYCYLEYWNRVSPSVVPDAFTSTVSHEGIDISIGAIGAAAVAEPHEGWMEITHQNPVISTVTNVSGVNQFFESMDSWLIVYTEEDLILVRAFIQSMLSLETNNLLKELIAKVGG